jgi:hypothetical protein
MAAQLTPGDLFGLLNAADAYAAAFGHDKETTQLMQLYKVLTTGTAADFACMMALCHTRYAEYLPADGQIDIHLINVHHHATFAWRPVTFKLKDATKSLHLCRFDRYNVAVLTTTMPDGEYRHALIAALYVRDA